MDGQRGSDGQRHPSLESEKGRRLNGKERGNFISTALEVNRDTWVVEVPVKAT